MSANIWDPTGGGVPYVGVAEFQTEELFVASAAQTDFNITTFTYQLGVNAIKVFVNGVYVTAIQEVDTNTFRMPVGAACAAGDIVSVWANLDITAEAIALSASIGAAESYMDAAQLAAHNSEVAAANSAAASTALSQAQVALAADQAALATSNGAAQVTLASAQKDLATAQAVIATAQAVIATQKATEVSDKAPLASPTFTGTPTAPTAAAGTSTTQLATTAFVTTAVAREAATTSQVLSAIAGASYGAVGTYLFARAYDPNAIPSNSPGTTRAGSQLYATSGAGATIGAALSGTWLCAGFASSVDVRSSPTLWLRIS